MTGKLILITGANSGIGLEAVKSLAADGHTVIATVRTEQKGQHTVREAKAVYPDADVSYMLLDVTDFESIKTFVDALQSELNGRYLDVLVNNAGRLAPENHEACPGLGGTEVTIAANALGPLILTELLLEHMKQSAQHSGEARIVFTNSSVTLSSLATLFNRDDLWLKKADNYTTNQLVPYKTAKEILMMGALALTDELGADSPLKINSLCPGAVQSSFFDNSRGIASAFSGFLKCCCCCCTRLSCCGMQSLERGGDDIVALAVRKRGAGTGNFYVTGKLRAPSALCLDKQNQKFVLEETRKFLAELQSTLE